MDSFENDALKPLGPAGQQIVADVGYVPNPLAAEPETPAGDSDDQAADAETADAAAAPPQQPE